MTDAADDAPPCAVFVAGFEDGSTKEDFEAAFSTHGEIAKVFIRDNRDKNYAFVTFTTAEAAATAVAEGATVKGNACTLELQTSKPRERKPRERKPRERKPRAEGEKKARKPRVRKPRGEGGEGGGQREPKEILTVYVNGIKAAIPDAGPREADEAVVEQMTEAFGKYGEIKKINYRGLNYAFIHYVSKEGVDAAVAGGNITIGAAEVTVEEGKPRQKRSKFPQGTSNTIYVKDLPENCDDSVIEGAFQTYGTISSITNKSERGFAFVEFATAEEMQAAIAVSGLSVGGSAVTIEEGKKRGRAPAADADAE